MKLSAERGDRPLLFGWPLPAYLGPPSFMILRRKLETEEIDRGELNAQALNCLKGARSISVTNLEQSREQLEILYMNDSQRQTV